MKIEDIIADQNYSEHPNKSLELGSVRLKGVGANISKVFGNFNQASKEIYETTVFEPFIRTLPFKGEGFLCHMMLLHEIQPTEESVAEKRMYFRVGEKTISYGAKEFCLITGFMFGKNIEPKKMFNFKGTQSKFGARVFPNTPEAEVTVSQLGQLLQKALDMLDIQDVDVVRLGLLYILCKGILGKDGCDKVCVEWFLLVDDLQAWDSFPWGSYLFCHAYKLSGYTVLFRIWIWEMLPQLSLINAAKMGTSLPRMVQWRQLKKIEWPAICKAFREKKTINNMRATDEERQQEYYKSYKAYIIGQGLEIPFPLRYLMKDEYLIISTDERFSPDQSPAASPENLGRREVGLENLEGRVRELEKKVNEKNYNYDKPNNYEMSYTEFSPADRGHFDHFNESPTEEADEELKQEPISPADGGHFDHFNEEPKEEANEELKQEPISPADGGHFDHFNEEPKEVANEELKQKPISPAYGGHFDHFNEEPKEEANEELKQEPLKEPKVEPNDETVGEVGVELGSDASEETFVEVVPEDCKVPRVRKRGVACRSPYTMDYGRKKKNASATGPLIMIPQDYTGFALQSYSGRYRMCWMFWDALMGAKAGGWLNNVHVQVWIRLLQESRINTADSTIMSFKYFSTPELLTTWSPWAEGAAIKDKPTLIPWWKVDRVFLPINQSDKHWILGELHLKTMTVHIYDSLQTMRSYKSLVANSTISKFKTSLIDLLDGINFWTKTNQARKKPADIQFEVIKDLDQQSEKLGDCGVFMCMWLEKLISGMPLTKEKDA
ncbi:hypothetical protein LXL04_006170 [Taraxacum kok-saghyz]